MDWRRFGRLTGGDGRENDAADALVQATKERTSGGAGGGIGIQAFIVRRLQAGLDGVEGIDEKVDREGGESTGDEDVGVGVVEGHCQDRPILRKASSASR